jgi:hypothetical protein
MSYAVELPMKPLDEVSLSGMTWYKSLGPLGVSSVSVPRVVFFRRSTKSGVSNPPGTVEVTEL